MLFPENLDQIIEQENEVRIIDLFVESIKLADFKFTIKTTAEGRPAYHPKDLLKLLFVRLIQTSNRISIELQITNYFNFLTTEIV